MNVWPLIGLMVIVLSVPIMLVLASYDIPKIEQLPSIILDNQYPGSDNGDPNA